MTTTAAIKLEEYDGEEISDILPDLEKTFAFRFTQDDFLHIKTFGDFCEVVSNHVQYEHTEDCTSQQAFYKIRQAIHLTQQIEINTILPGSQLADIFPHKGRRQHINRFNHKFGIKLDFLSYPGWISLTCVIGLLLSLVAFFFDWQIALSGLILCITILYIAEKTGKQLKLKTVKELTELSIRKHYIDMRRKPYTVNKNEVIPIIKELFNKHLDVDKQLLTPDALFSWAK
jgi:hypothetical protein